MQNSDTDIYCPGCKNKVTSVSIFRTSDLHTRCQSCGRELIYHIGTRRVEEKQRKYRATSSGMRFN